VTFPKSVLQNESFAARSFCCETSIFKTDPQSGSTHSNPFDISTNPRLFPGTAGKILKKVLDFPLHM